MLAYSGLLIKPSEGRVMRPQSRQFLEPMAGADAPRAAAREKSEAEMVESEFERATMRKIMRRFVPVLFVSCLVALLDRTNVGFAALTMNNDLGLSSAAFGFGAGVFFVTYMLFEVPSNLALERFGARRWIARIMFTWGCSPARPLSFKANTASMRLGCSWAPPKQDSFPACFSSSHCGCRPAIVHARSRFS